MSITPSLILFQTGYLTIAGYNKERKEKYYQTVFYLIFSLIGLTVETEVKTNKGRIDAIIIDKDVYIFEFTDRNVGEWIVEKRS